MAAGATLHRRGRVHPLARRLPRQRRWAGDADTIQAAGYGWQAGSPFTVTSLSVYRQVVDLGDPGAASFVIPAARPATRPARTSPTSSSRWAAHERIPMDARDRRASGTARVSGTARGAGQRGSEDDDLGPDGQVLVVVVRVRRVRWTQPCDHWVRLPPWNAMPPAAKNVAQGMGSW